MRSTDGIYVARGEEGKRLAELLLRHGVERSTTPVAKLLNLEIRINPYAPRNRAYVVSGDQVAVIALEGEP